MWVGLRYLLCLMTGNFILVMDNNIYTNISSCSKRLLIPQHKKKKTKLYNTSLAEIAL